MRSWIWGALLAAYVLFMISNLWTLWLVGGLWGLLGWALAGLAAYVVTQRRPREHQLYWLICGVLIAVVARLVGLGALSTLINLALNFVVLILLTRFWKAGKVK